MPKLGYDDADVYQLYFGRQFLFKGVLTTTFYSLHSMIIRKGPAAAGCFF